MKIAKKWVFGVLAVALFAACDGTYTDYKTVDSKLRGTWESTNPDEYSGTLVISFDTITITGYSESQTPPPWNGGDDSKRPFRDFAKGAPYSCYTDDGKLFIKKTDGNEQNFPYIYYPSGSEKYLRFTFGGRDEALKRTEN
jgi:hypothetical protein